MSIVVLTTWTSACRCDKCGKEGPHVSGRSNDAAVLAEIGVEMAGWEKRSVRCLTKTGRPTKRVEWVTVNLCLDCKSDADFHPHRPKEMPGSTG